MQIITAPNNSRHPTGFPIKLLNLLQKLQTNAVSNNSRRIAGFPFVFLGCLEI